MAGAGWDKRRAIEEGTDQTKDFIKDWLSLYMRGNLTSFLTGHPVKNKPVSGR